MGNSHFTSFQEFLQFLVPAVSDNSSNFSSRVGTLHEEHNNKLRIAGHSHIDISLSKPIPIIKKLESVPIYDARTSVYCMALRCPLIHLQYFDHMTTSRPCVACAHSHKRCPLSCDYARIFPNVIDREDYHTIFTVFGAISSYLLEATARIENPVRGCTALLASFEQKVEELQARVTALEARLGGGSSCANPLCSFAPLGGSSRFFSSVENNVPNVIPTAVNLSEPIAGGFLRLLMSEEGVQNILSTSTNLVENGAPLTEVDLPSFPNRSYDQATLDAVYQGASNSFLLQSSLDDLVVDFAETTGLD
ncbi:hypothetical protein LguiA_025614 [Lonicera macranthoides]